MEISKDKVVSMHYSVTDSEGIAIDASKEGDPLQFIFGRGMIIKGLEKALENKKVGDEFHVSVSPEDAYGVETLENIQSAPLSKFQEPEKIVVDVQLQLNDGSIARVTNVENDVVTMDFNHPLAGKTLEFTVVIDDVRDATKEELDHGHVHGPDSHCH